MRRRIFGLETEYGIACLHDGRRRLNPDEVARYLFRPVVEWGRSSNVFTTNGSRLYLDVGSHPEYATAECDGLDQLVLYDRAGELVLDRLAVQAEENLAAEGIGGEVFLFKNNTDSQGNSYGCHENLLVTRDAPFHRLASSLVPFLVTRQLICGAGKIRPAREQAPGSAGAARAAAAQAPEAAAFQLSQRADHMWEGISSATTRSRPMINTRDEPHADAARFRRLHVIVGDSNMSEPTTRLKVGTLTLMLEMLEAGVDLPEFTLDHPTRAIRTFAADITGRVTAPLEAGGEACALEIQCAYLEAASRYLAERADDPGSGITNAAQAEVVDLWGRTLDAVESGDHSAVHTEIDWMIKKRLFDSYIDRFDMPWDDARLARLDLAYHDIRPGRGVFRLLEERGRAARLTDPVAVDVAADEPPPTTRAALRGRFVQAAVAAGREYSVDWTHLKLAGDPTVTIACVDPFVAVDERVDALLDRL